MTTSRQRDPITLEVINNRLGEIALSMEWLLFHGGYSTILRESFDGSAGVTDLEGRSVVTSGYPLHIPAYYYNVQGVIRQHPLEEMQEGDSFITSDPYVAGNIHVPDVAIVTPVFYRGKIIAFCVSIAHEPDVGGLVPSSSSPDAREIFHEGLLLPGIRYWTKDGIVKDAEALIRSNTRVADILLGDLRAHVGCTRAGARRLQELCDEYSLDTVLDAFEELQSASEQRVRAAVESWPDGESEAGQVLEVQGFNLDAPIRVHVKLVKRGGMLTVDLSQSSPQIKVPINIRPQSTETAVLFALLSFLDPSIPINHGAWRVVQLISPEGLITNARWPAPVNNYYPVTYVVYLCVLSALRHFEGQRAFGSAGLGTGTIAFGYPRDRRGERAVSYELMVSSLGATPEGDGTFVVTPITHIVPSTPIEITETEFPVMIECHEIVPDSGGAGLHRGGMGYRKRYVLQDEAMFTVRLNPLKSSGWGALGGHPGPPEMIFTSIQSTQGEERLPPMATRELRAGDSVLSQQTGGGGYGDAFERETENVIEDIRNGYVSVEGAKRDYGVVVDPVTLALDAQATAQLRRSGRPSGPSLKSNF